MAVGPLHDAIGLTTPYAKKWLPVEAGEDCGWRPRFQPQFDSASPLRTCKSLVCSVQSSGKVLVCEGRYQHRFEGKRDSSARGRESAAKGEGSALVGIKDSSI
ncbi:hypothetical protein CIHG_02660 [Coccidioides immitis H538.4]|uniref:Uncharacterized protein n=2 Tax=Coccidioides immitis TaxID=5501 RepID=A0A0J8RJ54_COCIT|nr:hypothetical protein CIRG_02985 [Coccidioides immitis RMSCC 2394]KMU84877.1 hypothetical protein CIHG_02660 [Coccidioides immitis H538.4]